MFHIKKNDGPLTPVDDVFMTARAGKFREIETWINDGELIQDENGVFMIRFNLTSHYQQEPGTELYFTLEIPKDPRLTKALNLLKRAQESLLDMESFCDNNGFGDEREVFDARGVWQDLDKFFESVKTGGQE
jgi:hypothetical protein